MTELRYPLARRFLPILVALFFPAAIFVVFALRHSNGFSIPTPRTFALLFAAYAALVAWPATLRFRTCLRYGDDGIVWRSGLGPTVRIPRSRIITWEHVVFDRSDSLWLVHYRAPNGRHRTIHIPNALVQTSYAQRLPFQIWLPSNFHDLRVIFPRYPLRFRWFTLS